MRDWRAGLTCPTDPALLNLLWALRRRLGVEEDDRPLEAVCGYRSPGTDAAPRRGGVGYYPDAGLVHVDTGPARSW